MSSILYKRVAAVGVAVVVCTFGSSAFAVSTWSSSNFGSLCNSTNNVVAASGLWGHCGAVGSSDPDFMGLSTATASSPYSGSTFAGAQVYDWGDTNGLGVINRYESNTTGPHAIDNYRGTDAILLRFSDAVTLTSFSIGWNGTDNGSGTRYNGSDVSVLAWSVVGAPSVGGAAPVGLASTGWSWVGNYASVGTGSNTENITPTSLSGSAVYSSYWLISAYNTAYGTTSKNSGTLSAGVDAFKLLSIAGNTRPLGDSKVPEPGSVALLGLGLVGIVAARRRKQASL